MVILRMLLIRSCVISSWESLSSDSSENLLEFIEQEDSLDFVTAVKMCSSAPFLPGMPRYTFEIYMI